MNDSFKVDIVLICLLLGLPVCLVYSGYRYGRWMERKILAKAFVDQVGAAYFDGHGDAERDCREGLIK